MPSGVPGGHGLPQLHLGIAEGLLIRQPAWINTVLGSCVAATFRHAPSGLCGMFHAMLPNNPDGRRGPHPCKYVDSAATRIVESFFNRGIKPRQITVKLFGGGYNIERATPTVIREDLDVGARNVEAAKKLLREFGLLINVQDTLGNQGRRVLFNTATGDVWVKKLQQITPGLVEREKALRRERP